MTKKNILFFTLLLLFLLTAAIALLGVLKIIIIDDFYLKGLFAAFLLELAATIFSIATKGNILEENKEPSKAKKSKSTQDTSISLHIWGDHRAPNRISASNIYRWYYLQNITKGITQAGEEITQSIFCTLFIAFENEVQVSTLNVRSPDMNLPIYEVKEFNPRFAIIAFNGAVNVGTLEVSVSL